MAKFVAGPSRSELLRSEQMSDDSKDPKLPIQNVDVADLRLSPSKDWSIPNVDKAESPILQLAQPDRKSVV